MKENKLTMSKNFLDILNISESMIKDIPFAGFNFRDIVELFESDRFTKLSSGARTKYLSFPEVMERIEKEFGTLPKLLYWFGLLTDCIYEDDGTYCHMFECTYLMTDECQSTEYFELDLLKKYSDEFVDFISKFQNCTDELREHFASIEVKLDRRSTITAKDKEFDEMVKDVKEYLPDDDLFIDFEKSSFNGMIFKNPREDDIFNIEELADKSLDLLKLLSDFDVGRILLTEFKTLGEKCFEQRENEIKLRVCVSSELWDTPGAFCFSDFHKIHPVKNAANFKVALDRFIESRDSELFVVDTSSIYVFNIIRRYLIDEKIVLENDTFEYEDTDGKLHKFKIGKDYWIDPLFAKDFLEVAYVDKG